MNVLKGTALALATLGLGGAAQAQGTPNWGGFFIGGHAGGGFANNSTVEEGFSGRGEFDSFPGEGQGDSIMGPGSVLYRLSNDPDGFLGGGQVGFNVQSGRMVWGVLADLSLTDLDDYNVARMGPGEMPPFITCQCSQGEGMGEGMGGPFSARTKVNFAGTLRLRGGYLLTPSVLGYAHGGLAAARVETQLMGGPYGGASNNSTELGFVVGGGIEAMVMPGVSLFAEYGYMHLGDSNRTLGNSSQGTEFRMDNSDGIHTIKVGVNLAIRTR